MNEGQQNRQREFADDIGRREREKLEAKKRGDDNLWFGLGMFGLVGWSFSIPTLVILGLGIWLDSAVSSPYSFTLTGLVLGVFAGAANAWFWVSRERKKIDERDE
jgi:ATP synthase protein I